MRLGKLAAVRPHGLADLAVYANGKLPEPPQQVTPPTWAMEMAGNNAYGDCVLAGAANSIGLADALVGGNAPIPPDEAVVQQYCALTGCQQPEDSHDTGLVEADVLKLWQTDGLFGVATGPVCEEPDKIAGYAPVNPRDVMALQQTVACYGFVYGGFQLQQAMQQQFGAGQPLDYVPGSPWIGGHCMLIVGYTSDSWLIYTWQQVVKASYRFVAACMDEAWATIPEAFVTAGRGPDLDLAALQADLAALA